MSMTVCAIIINYFNADKTAWCIRSLCSEPLTSLLLVDNSGTEDEREAMTHLVEQTRQAGPSFQINLICNDRNLGFGRAINSAIAQDRHTTGGHDYYLLMNNDAESEPGLVAGLLKAALADPQLALIAPKIIWNGNEVTYYWYQPLIGHVSRTAFPGSFRYLSGCCLLVDNALCPDGKFFDEIFFMYGEDIELTARAKGLRRTITCVEDLVIHHEGSGSSAHGSRFYEYHVARGHMLLATKLATSPADRLLKVTGRLFYLILRAVFRALRFRSLDPIRVLAEIFGR